ncbi:MAG: F0F1 ATP synthase subunit A, partial [Chloroflexota bacterium]|nr:F0F1 ATP synthase subunit A [Chloroflexota bacterium]
MDVHVELAAETLFHLGPVPITNSLLTMLLVMAFILLAGTLIARRARTIPAGRAQGVAELIVEFLLGLVEGTAGRNAGRRIFPLVGGIFIFILFANYSGLLPGVGTVGYWHEEEAEASHEVVAADIEGEDAAAPGAVEAGEEAISDEEHATTDAAAATTGDGGDEAAVATDEEAHDRVLVPYLRAPNADLNMTLAMALLTFTVVQIAGINAHGFIGRIKHMADPWWIFPLELIQEFARIISLSFRLFGNIFAGEVLLAVMYALANAIKIA